MRALIVANGAITDPQLTLRNLPAWDLLVAADGGARNCRLLGIKPDMVVGDLDSLSPQDMSDLEAGGAEIIRYPARKDFTDLELALRHARERGATEIVIAAALGARWDQTLANLLLPAAAPFASLRISLLDGAQEVLLVQPGQRLELRGQPGDTVSLIPLAGDADGITTQGLEYPLHTEALHFGSTRGISNVLRAETGNVWLQEGLLLCVIIHQPAPSDRGVEEG